MSDVNDPIMPTRSGALDRDDAETPFYVGYAAQAPSSLARFYRRLLPLLFLSVGLLAALAAATMKPLPEAYFEFGHVRTFEGRLAASPVPSLLVERPGFAGLLSPRTRHLLSRPGKYGAGPLIEGVEGSTVRLEGTLAWRGNQSLIEVVEGSVEVLAAPDDGSGSGSGTGPDSSDVGLPPRSEPSDRRTLSGEIVGAKCFLGVMVPGETRVHQACASLCIRGGIPALFVVRDGEASTAYLLVDEEGRGLGRTVLPLVGGTVELRGRVSRTEDWNLFHVESKSLEAAGPSLGLGSRFLPAALSARTICAIPGSDLETP